MPASSCAATAFMPLLPEAISSTRMCSRLRLTQQGIAQFVAEHGNLWLISGAYGMGVEGCLLQAVGDTLRIPVTIPHPDVNEFCERRTDGTTAPTVLREYATNMIASQFAGAILIERETTDWAKISRGHSRRRLDRHHSGPGVLARHLYGHNSYLSMNVLSWVKGCLPWYSARFNQYLTCLA